MPDNNIVVTLKTEKPGGPWPFVRGCFAWIGFSVVVVVGVVMLGAPKPDRAQMIEGVVHVLNVAPLTPEERICNRYDDQYSAERCAFLTDPDPYANAPTAPANNPQ